MRTIVIAVLIALIISVPAVSYGTVEAWTNERLTAEVKTLKQQTRELRGEIRFVMVWIEKREQIRAKLIRRGQR